MPPKKTGRSRLTLLFDSLLPAPVAGSRFRLTTFPVNSAGVANVKVADLDTDRKDGRREEKADIVIHSNINNY